MDYLLEAQRRDLLYNDGSESEEPEQRAGNVFADSTDEDEKKCTIFFLNF